MLTNRLTNIFLFNIIIPKNAYSTVSNANYDLTIVGGGIVGLATAQEMIKRYLILYLYRYPKMKITVLEKEKHVSEHQSGHNSGVIHAGVYYTPGSLKAKLCVQGMKMAYEFCDSNGIPYNRCGKLIVAVENKELPLLDNLMERGKKNNVAGLEMVEGKDIPQIEPHCRGLRALFSPNTGIVNWKQVAQKYGSNFEKLGGSIHCGYKVTYFKYNDNNPDHPIIIKGDSNSSIINSKYVITCAGLYSDKIAELSGCSPIPKIVPFRGEYLLLNSDKRYLVKGNIYPVPDPRLPFLGVHFTPRMDGNVWLGPNAVLAFSREGYKFSDINFSEICDYATFSGFRKLSLKYLVPGLREMYESIYLKAKLSALQRFP